jgi:hypothetical protein
MDGPLLTHEEMLTTGINYRQLDYWTNQGYLHCLDRKADKSGYPRRWPLAEREIAALMVRMIKAGIVPAVAATAARDAIENHPDYAVIGNGLTIDLTTSWSEVA